MEITCFSVFLPVRYAFLRCDDEREQALMHLQTLTTVDFTCFTNAYTNSAILYQVSTDALTTQ